MLMSLNESSTREARMLTPSATATTLVAAAVLALALAAGLYGIGRSLWLDEVWAANSIQAPSLAGMFYYSGWLQVNPPLFLLLALGASHIFGLSNAALRIVPLALALAAVVGMLAIARRLLRPALAVLACALVAAHPTAIDYSRTLKPYTGEMAGTVALLLAAVLYLEHPNRSRYLWLMAAVMVALPLGYATAFALPGVVIAVYFAGDSGTVRAGGLAAVGGSVLAILYFVFARPNLSPDLRAFWAVDPTGGFTRGLALELLFLVAVAVRVSIDVSRGRGISRRRAGLREWVQIMCLLPWLLLTVSGGMGWYPISARTRLFALPCFLLVAAINTEDLIRWVLDRLPRRRRVEHAMAGVVLLLAVATPAAALWGQVHDHRDLPEEDLEGAVRFMQQHVLPDELVVVHAECREGFRFYAARLGWRPRHVVFGDTGWPCCARGEPSGPGNSRERDVVADLDSLIPHGYRGRLWLLYSTRPTQWSYTGLDEGKVWRSHVWAAGCPPGPYYEFANLAVTPMDCLGYRPTPP
jgi:Dolichyl-phosphate-mannose-protein mannosyltransferase